MKEVREGGSKEGSKERRKEGKKGARKEGRKEGLHAVPAQKLKPEKCALFEASEERIRRRTLRSTLVRFFKNAPNSGSF